MKKLSLRDDAGSFEVTLINDARPSRAVLFAVGAGGNPERHLSLLLALAQESVAVVAPHFERMTSPNPTDEALLLRTRRLKAALDLVANPTLPAVGVGHSIGAASLIALAGGKMWTRPGAPLPIAADARIARLALMAPATGFFLAPGALDAVSAPMVVWAGTDDTVTPPSQAHFLAHALTPRVPVEVRAVQGAGHFSFMNVLPPQVADSMPNRETFLSLLAAEIGEIVAA
jgi:pimeloyl-ACP methyl ester carboxylesterase